MIAIYATDFEYNNKYLSDYGFMVCSFDTSSGADTVDSGADITFNTVAQGNGSSYLLTGTKYEDCITATFDICKDPDIYDDLEITNEEYSKLARWLNRKQFLRFRVIDEEHETTPCYYEVSFNISKIKIRERLYGLELEMTSNKPLDRKSVV